jgi:hypothetical protein
MPHSYASEYSGDFSVTAGIKTFEAIYERSYISGEHEKYAEFFTDDATIFIGSRIAIGRQGIYPCFLSLQHFFVEVKDQHF